MEAVCVGVVAWSAAVEHVAAVEGVPVVATVAQFGSMMSKSPGIAVSIALWTDCEAET